MRKANVQEVWVGVICRFRDFLLLLGMALFAAQAFAFSAPEFQGDVLDETGKLDAGQQAEIRQRIARLRSEDGIWAAVYLTRNLQGDSIEAAAVATFERWKLGQKEKDNGLLVMIAPNERRMRIEVGYGLEGTITDVVSKHIIDEIYKPAFREERFAEGMLAGFERLSQVVGQGGETALAAEGELATAQPVDFDGELFFQRLLGVWGLNLCVPLIYWAVLRRRSKRKSDDREKLRSTFVLFAFFGLFFGLFISVFSVAFPDDPGVLLGLGGMNALVDFLFFIGVARGGGLRSGGGSGTETESWRSGSSSSSSWDSGSSDSSSSDGGSSGGGGASGDY